MKVKVILHGLCCANCGAKIEEKVAALEGVENTSVNFLTEKMILTADEGRLDAIKTEITRIVRKIEPDVTVEFL